MEDIIRKIEAREILSGIGRPTVEVDLITQKGTFVTASVPSGTSKGKYEAYELYDGGRRYGGLGVRKAVENVNSVIGPALCGKDVTRQRALDRIMIEMDGTKNKSRLGGNAILGVSMAIARAAASVSHMPLYQYIGGIGSTRLPLPLVTILAGGKHSSSRLDFEDYLLVPSRFDSFGDSVEALLETRKALKSMLNEKHGTIPEVGGAFSPPMRETSEAFEFMLAAIEKAGFSGRMSLGLDVAASEFYDSQKDLYCLSQRKITADDLLAIYIQLAKDYPLVFIEDPFHQEDFDRFAALTAALPSIKIVGDDLFATNPERILKGIQKGAANTLLLKINQIGTISEACNAGSLSVDNQYGIAVSIRSSDTNDNFIADMAVGVRAEQIKLGSPVRGERSAKYNRLLAIEQELGADACLARAENQYQGKKA